jgi:UDP-N-acetylglucosamine 2-epimerase (non-hydrolysing)
VAEGVPEERIACTGNTVVDAALLVRCPPIARDSPLGAIRRSGRRLVLVTVHRRESWGAPLRSITAAVAQIVAQVPDVEVVLPVHPNPVVRDVVEGELGGRDRIHIVEPLDHPAFIGHLAQATLVLSDSGGVQEEAPTFGVPVLVLRSTTERPEAVHAGSAELVGSDTAHVVARATRLLLDEDARLAMATISNPFGDGSAGRQAVTAITRLFHPEAQGDCDDEPPQEPRRPHLRVVGGAGDEPMAAGNGA